MDTTRQIDKSMMMDLELLVFAFLDTLFGSSIIGSLATRSDRHFYDNDNAWLYSMNLVSLAVNEILLDTDLLR